MLLSEATYIYSIYSKSIFKYTCGYAYPYECLFICCQTLCVLCMLLCAIILVCMLHVFHIYLLVCLFNFCVNTYVQSICDCVCLCVRVRVRVRVRVSVCVCVCVC